MSQRTPAPDRLHNILGLRRYRATPFHLMYKTGIEMTDGDSHLR